NTLERLSDSKDTCADIIHALGIIRDERAFSTFEQYAATSTGRVQEEALLALSRFSRGKYQTKYIRKYIESDNPRVREIAFAAILRMRSRYWEKIIAAALARENDEHLRFSVLSSIRSIHTKKMVNIVFKMALGDFSPRIKLIARSLFARVKSPFILSWVIKREAKTIGEEKALLLQFLSEYRDSKSVFQILKSRSLEANENIIRLVSLEALGQVRDDRVVPFLMTQVRAVTIFSYIAAVSLLKTINRDNIGILEDLFTMDHKGMYSIIQLCLKFVMRLPEKYEISEKIKLKIREYVSSDNKQVRYLAVRCMSKVSRDDLIEVLMKLSKDDPDIIVRSGAMRDLVEYLQEYPDKLMSILLICLDDKRFFSVAYRLSFQIEVNHETFERDLKNFIALIHQCGNTYDSARLMVIMKNWIRQHKSAFVRRLKIGAWEDKERLIFIKIINSSGIHEMYGFNAGFMADQYLCSSVDTKLEYLRFFERMAVTDSKIEKVVYHELQFGTEKRVLKMVDEVISSWIKKSLNTEFKAVSGVAWPEIL
ncbi:MAG: HEAT repeat domain-containing protein, partial [Candidatus Theseobacter exili]|nr:HEAT repeat domain-containing protein [Candidatus Theseobacter exili]